MSTLPSPTRRCSRRFHLDIVGDREGLAHLDRNGTESGDEDGNKNRFRALGIYCRRRFAGVDIGSCPGDNPRFCVFLVMDLEASRRWLNRPPRYRCCGVRWT